MLRKIIFTWAALLALAVPAAAFASNQDRVAIHSFKGPQAQRLQGAFETGLMSRYYVIPDFSVEEMARKRGVALGSATGMAEVGRALQVRAFLSAEVQKKRGWHVNVVVRSGDTGAAIGRFVVAHKKLDQLESTLAARTSRRVGALLARASYQAQAQAQVAVQMPVQTVMQPALAPAAVQMPVQAPVAAALEPAPVSENVEVAAKAERAAPAEEARMSRPGEIIEIGVDTRVFNRSFSYAQNLSGLSDYNLSGAVAASADLRFHPLAMVAESLAPLGVQAGIEYGLAVGSRLAGSEQRIATDVHGYSVGLAYRVRLGQHTLTPTVGYALSAFDSGQNLAAPNVDYRYVKGGLDGRFAATERLALLGRAEYLHALDSGPLTAANRFPRASVRGVEASLGLAYAVTSAIDVEANAGLRRFGITSNVVPGDRWVVGGAVDQTTWLGLGVAYRPSYARK